MLQWLYVFSSVLDFIKAVCNVIVCWQHITPACVIHKTSHTFKVSIVSLCTEILPTSRAFTSATLQGQFILYVTVTISMNETSTIYVIINWWCRFDHWMCMFCSPARLQAQVHVKPNSQHYCWIVTLYFCNNVCGHKSYNAKNYIFLLTTVIYSVTKHILVAAEPENRDVEFVFV